MKTLNFGFELEIVSLSRQNTAAAIQRATGGRVGGDNHHATVTMADGRVWNIVADGSLSGEVNGEIVSPILNYGDIDMIQNAVREVRKAGARCDHSTGMHVHIGAENFSVRAITNLIKTFAKYELVIEKALGVSEARLQRYCKRVDPAMLRRLETQRPTTVEGLSTAWFGSPNVTPRRYDPSRYVMLNVLSYFVRKTIEIRAFEGTLHAGEVKANIQFCLALAAAAMKAKSASSKKRPYVESSGRFDMRVFAVRIGLVGDEFATARFHLTKRLSGSSAWKHGRPTPATTTAAVA